MKKFQTAGAIFTIAAGTLLHFVYEWTGENKLAAIFSAVNESTWEHLKLLAIPLIFFAVIEYFAYGKRLKNFVPVKILSAFVGMSAIVVIFYTYVGVVGRHFLWADIATFVAGVLAAYAFSAHFLRGNRFSSRTAISLAWLALLMTLVGFALFTFYPPRLGIFLDPTLGGK
ncbi:MAG: DUF6512 family protein [Oscillospiraceae bacterium]